METKVGKEMSSVSGIASHCPLYICNGMEGWDNSNYIITKELIWYVPGFVDDYCCRFEAVVSNSTGLTPPS